MSTPHNEADKGDLPKQYLCREIRSALNLSQIHFLQMCVR